MRDRTVRLVSGGRLEAGADSDARAWLELHNPSSPTASARLTDGELRLLIEALTIVYAALCGANPDSLARGVDRTIRNRTRAAREKRVTDRRAA